MKSKSAAKIESESGQATEFERFTKGLRKILSVRLSDLPNVDPPRTVAEEEEYALGLWRSPEP